MHENSLNNLKPFTKETARENGIKGGIAAQKKIKEKKNLLQLANWFLDVKINPKWYQEERLDYLKKNLTNAEALIVTQMVKAIRGDTYSAIFIRDTAGQKPTDKQEIKGQLSVEELLRKVTSEDAY